MGAGSLPLKPPMAITGSPVSRMTGAATSAPTLAAGVLTVLHDPAGPVTNSIHLATRRGRENLPRIRAVFTALLR
ncbi:hypothetical protein [Crossiella sp. CA198]|uniref:hypothetical protein n=1 Tax=Crossiella sp. CA198 TaxID=3455607 RepID=UPI003F8D76BC